MSSSFYVSQPFNQTTPTAMQRTSPFMPTTPFYTSQQPISNLQPTFFDLQQSIPSVQPTFMPVSPTFMPITPSDGSPDQLMPIVPDHTHDTTETTNFNSTRNPWLWTTIVLIFLVVIIFIITIIILYRKRDKWNVKDLTNFLWT